MEKRSLKIAQGRNIRRVIAFLMCIALTLGTISIGGSKYDSRAAAITIGDVNIGSSFFSDKNLTNENSHFTVISPSDKVQINLPEFSSESGYKWYENNENPPTISFSGDEFEVVGGTPATVLNSTREVVLYKITDAPYQPLKLEPISTVKMEIDTNYGTTLSAAFTNGKLSITGATSFTDTDTTLYCCNDAVFAYEKKVGDADPKDVTSSATLTTWGTSLSDIENEISKSGNDYDGTWYIYKKITLKDSANTPIWFDYVEVTRDFYIDIASVSATAGGEAATLTATADNPNNYTLDGVLPSQEVALTFTPGTDESLDDLVVTSSEGTTVSKESGTGVVVTIPANDQDDGTGSSRTVTVSISEDGKEDVEYAFTINYLAINPQSVVIDTVNGAAYITGSTVYDNSESTPSIPIVSTITAPTGLNVKNAELVKITKTTVTDPETQEEKEAEVETVVEKAVNDETGFTGDDLANTKHVTFNAVPEKGSNVYQVKGITSADGTKNSESVTIFYDPDVPVISNGTVSQNSETVSSNLAADDTVVISSLLDSTFTFPVSDGESGSGIDTSAANIPVMVIDGDTDVTIEGTADGGNYTFSLSAAKAQSLAADVKGKTYTATVTVKDLAGNEAARSFEIKFYAETITIGHEVVPGVADGMTGGTETKIQYTVNSDVPLTGATIAYTRNGVAENASPITIEKEEHDASGNYTYTYSRTLETNTSAIYESIDFTATNKNGKSATYTVDILKIDLTSPGYTSQWKNGENAEAIMAGTTGWTEGLNAADWYTALVLQVVFDDSIGEGAVTGAVSGIDTGSESFVHSGVEICSATLDDTTGKYTVFMSVNDSPNIEGTPVSFSIKDKKGNQTAEFSQTYYVDSKAPTIDQELKAENVREGIITADDPTISFKVHDEIKVNSVKFEITKPGAADPVEYEPKDSNGEPIENISLKLSTMLGLAESALPEVGEYAVTVAVTDLAGNTVDDAISFTLDYLAPVVDIEIDNPASNAPKFDDHHTTYTYDDTSKGTYDYAQYYNKDVTMTLSARDYQIDNDCIKAADGTKKIGGFTESPAGTWTESYTADTEGEHSIIIFSNDKGGLESNTKTVTFVVDKTAPVLDVKLNGDTVTADKKMFNDGNNAVISFTVTDTYEDTSDLKKTVKYTAPDGTEETKDPEAIVYNAAEQKYTDDSYTADGDYEITYVATDLAGNTSEKTTVKFRIDHSAPEFTVKAEQSGEEIDVTPTSASDTAHFKLDEKLTNTEAATLIVDVSDNIDAASDLEVAVVLSNTAETNLVGTNTEGTVWTFPMDMSLFGDEDPRGKTYTATITVKDAAENETVKYVDITFYSEEVKVSSRIVPVSETALLTTDGDTNTGALNIIYTIQADAPVEEAALALKKKNKTGRTTQNVSVTKDDLNQVTATDADLPYQYEYTFEITDTENTLYNDITFTAKNIHGIECVSPDVISIIRIDLNAPELEDVQWKETEGDPWTTEDGDKWYKSLLLQVVYSDGTISSGIDQQSFIDSLSGAEVFDNTISLNADSTKLTAILQVDKSTSEEGTAVSFEVKDNVENLSGKYEHTFYVDMVDPTVEKELYTELQAEEMNGDPKIGYETSDDIKIAKAVLEITLPDKTTVTLSSEDDNALISGILEPTALSTLLNVEEPADGAYNFHLTVYDLAGRMAESTLSIKLDNTLPVTGIGLQGAYRKLDGKNHITHTDTYYTEGYEYNQFNNMESLVFDLYVSKDVQLDKTVFNDSLGNSHLDVSDWVESGDYLHATATLTGEGIHTLTLKTVDNVGNDSETAEFKIELDHTIPTINLAVDGVVDAEDDLYYKEPATVKFTVTEKNPDDEENALYITKVYTDGSGTKEETVKPVEQGELTFDEDAYYTLRFAVKDLAGNTATRTISFTVDTKDPVADIIIKDPTDAKKYDKYQTEYSHEATGKTYTYAQYFDRDVEITAEAFDYLFKEVSVTDNGTVILSYEAEEGESIQNWSENYTVTEEGEHVIRITAKDIGGREAEVQTVTFYIDKSAPEIATKLDGKDTVEEKVYLDKDGVISVKITDAYMDEDDLLQTVTITRPGKTAETSESYVAIDGDNEFSDEADYVVYYTATDRAGNVTTGSNIIFRVDKTAPEMSITVEQDEKAVAIENGALVDKVTSTRPVVFYVDVFDNLNEAAEDGIDPSTVTLTIGGQNVESVIDGNRCSFTIDPVELLGSPRGKTYTATIQATDRSGNIIKENVSLTFFTERVVVSHTISPSLKTSTDTNSRQTNVVFTIQSDVPLKDVTLTWKKDSASNNRVIDAADLTVGSALSDDLPYLYTYTMSLSDSTSTLYENISLYGTNINEVSGSSDGVSVIRVDLDNPQWSVSVPATEEWFQSLVIQVQFTDGNPTTSSGLVTDTFYSSLTGGTASGGGGAGGNSFSVTIVVNPSLNEKGTPVSFHIQDTVGNTSTTFNRIYYVDDTDPVINAFYVDGKQGEEKINGDPMIVYKSTDNIRIGEVTMEITGPDFKKTITSDTDSRLKDKGASLTLSQLLDITEDELKDGDYTIKLSVFDLSKRTDTESISFKLDNTTPDTGITLREAYRNADGKYPVTHTDWVNKDGYIYNRYINKDSAVFDLYVSEDVPTKNIVVKDSAGSQYLTVSSWTKDGTGYLHAVATITGEGLDHVLSLGAKDDVGNDTQMITFEFTLDTTPPAISLKVNDKSNYKEGEYYSGAVTVDFSVTDRNKDDGENRLVITKTYNDGSGTVTETVDNLTEGSLVFDEDAKYTLDYSAKDKAGNVSHKTTGFIIDKVDPIVDLLIRDPMDAPKAQSFKNTYRNNISGKTYEYANYFNRSVIVDLNVTDDTVYSVSVYDNGSLVRTKTIDLESKNVRGWSDNYTASSEGEHVIRINATDRAGRTAAEQTVSFVIDRTAPVVSTTLNGNSFSEGAPTQYLSSNGIIGVSVSDANKDDGDLTRILRISPPGRGTAVTTEHIQEGNSTYSEEADYEVTFSAIDRAGNESASRTVTFRVDMTAPVLNITSDAYDGVSKTEVIVTYNVVEAFYADMELAKVMVYKKVDGSAEQLLRTDDFRATGQNSSMQLKLEEDGNYRFVFDARDRTGNTATTNYTVMLDKNAPVIILDGVANYDKTKQDVTLGVKITETFYLTNKVDVSGTRTDIEDKKEKIVFDQMDFSKINRASETDLEQTFKEDGIYDIVIKSTDQAGNVTDKDVNFTIDKTPPVIGDLSKYDGKRLREFVWDIDERKLVTDLTACEVTVYLDGVVYDGITVPADGSHILRVVAKDELGNESSKEVTFVLDTIKPNFIITGIENNQRIEEPTTIHVSLQLDEDVLDSVTINGVEQSIAGNQAVIIIDKTGSYTLVAKAHDEAGNIAELTWNFSYGTAGSLLWVIIGSIAAVLLLGVLILIRAKSWKQKK